MAILHRLNTILSVLLEIAMLAAFGYWGFRTGGSVWLKWGLAIGVPLAVFIAWGLFLAPKRGRRVSGTTEMIISVLLFYLAALTLFQANQPILGTAMMIAAAINRTLVGVWKQS